MMVPGPFRESSITAKQISRARLRCRTGEIKDSESEMQAEETPSAESPGSFRRIARGFWVGVLLTVVWIIWCEFDRLGRGIHAAEVANWFVDMRLDSSPFLLLLALLPICWFPRSDIVANLTGLKRVWELWFGRSTRPGGPPADRFAGARVLLLVLVVGAISALCGWSISQKVVVPRQGIRFGELPPAYHDEYSYLLQARTFLAGRVSYPSHPAVPEIFDQPHVVNEGTYASRYFPATGAWIAPFLSLGKPYWGHWLAGAISSMLIFAAGRELGGNGVGFLAGVLTALSPGMAVFSNLLLAHHPAMLGLSLFLFSFLRMLRTAHWGAALVAGTGLSFAMLARPMTAAGFGFPFGVWFVCWVFRRRGESAGSKQWTFRLSRLAAMGAPLIAGFGILGAFNNAITGNPFITPYDVFTRVYTPRHVYGFNNVQRAERQIEQGEALTKTTFENYDRWAENLTPRLAARNVWNRLEASWQWSLAIVPLLIALSVFLASAQRDDRRWWLIPAAIVSLHLAHVPYWYDGIAHWHYVFESGPLWLLLFARSTQFVCASWRSAGRGWMPVWWGALVAVSLSTAYFSHTPFWPVGRVDAEVANIAFSRWKYRQFHDLIERRVQEPQALILIEHDPADRHIDYVTNEPDLQGDQRLLFGRFLPGQTDPDTIAETFPNRAIYLYRVRTARLEQISSP